MTPPKIQKTSRIGSWLSTELVIWIGTPPISASTIGMITVSRDE
jgi:hypothetical protein